MKKCSFYIVSTVVLGFILALFLVYHVPIWTQMISKTEYTNIEQLAIDGKLDELRSHLRGSGNVTWFDANGTTPILECAAARKLSALPLLTQYYGPGFAEREDWLEFGIYFQTEELVEYCLREMDPKTILRNREIAAKATKSKNLRVLKWLAARGYDPNLPASGYGTILDMARTMKWQEGEKFIESWMKDYGSPSPKGW